MRSPVAMIKLLPIITSILVIFMLLSPASHAQLYKWVDGDGKIHYGDSPPDNVKLKKITGKVTSYSSVSVEPFVANPNNTTRRKKSKKVVMYSTSWCGYCKKAARHFRKNKIPFTEYDIEKSARAAGEYKKLKGRGVPVILIGDRRMNGFEARAFDKIYYGKS